MLRLKAAQSLFEQLCLGIACREVNKNPSNRLSDFTSFELLVQLDLFCLQGFNLLPLKVLLLKFRLDLSEALVDLNLATSLLLNFSLLGLRALVRILDAQFCDEAVDVE